MASPVIVLSSNIPYDVCPRSWSIIPWRYCCKSPNISPILVGPLPVFTTCHFGSREETFWLDPSAVCTLANRHPTDKEKQWKKDSMKLATGKWFKEKNHIIDYCFIDYVVK